MASKLEARIAAESTALADSLTNLFKRQNERQEQVRQVFERELLRLRFSEADLYNMPLSELRGLADAEATDKLAEIRDAKIAREIEDETMNGLLEVRE